MRRVELLSPTFPLYAVPRWRDSTYGAPARVHQNGEGRAPGGCTGARATWGNQGQRSDGQRRCLLFLMFGQVTTIAVGGSIPVIRSVRRTAPEQRTRFARQGPSSCSGCTGPPRPGLSALAAGNRPSAKYLPPVTASFLGPRSYALPSSLSIGRVPTSFPRISLVGALERGGSAWRSGYRTPYSPACAPPW